MKKTLMSLFENPDFKNTYFNHIDESAHECVENIYHDFCCGSTYKKQGTFNSKYNVQIQIGADEFDPLDALKSKAGQHKILGIYFVIRNLPDWCRSKLNNIFLVALVNASDLKQEDCSIDDVLEVIVDELKDLEINGIQIDQNTNIKASLVSLIGDNLGLNGLLGFTESFNSHYYCRFCTCKKVDCKKLTREVTNQLRDRDNYNNHVSKIDNDHPDLLLTNGVKRFCLLNDLKYFNIFDNVSVDPMHDLLEGVVPFFLRNLFRKMTQNRVLSLSNIQSCIRDFNYGFLHKKYQPSNISLEGNLGQNAMQLRNIIYFLPFIFNAHIPNNFQEPLEDLLQIVQIAFSTKIDYSDINRLKLCIEKHLNFLINKLSCELIPKHHFLVHYPHIIEKMGPVIHMWTMRMESKHKVFTDMVHQTSNFKNIPMTLALTHQERLCIIQDAFVNQIEKSATFYKIAESTTFKKYKYVPLITGIEKDNNMFGLKFLILNSIEFRPGLFVFDNNDKLYEIDHILPHEADFLLFCQPFKINKFNLFLNSIEIENQLGSNCEIISLKTLKLKRSYEKLELNNKYYIISDDNYVYKSSMENNN